MVIEEIRKYGFYSHGPEQWGKDDQELDSLKKSGVIESFYRAGIEFSNPDYFYVETGNPRGVYILEDSRPGRKGISRPTLPTKD